MDLAHDVHDWLGGYPYESILPGEVEKLMQELGFQLNRTLVVGASRSRQQGLQGSGGDQYSFSAPPANS
jgi:hypothetical protein